MTSGNTTVRQHFMQALEGLVEQVRHDRSVLAAVLCGSLSHDTVWARSDIDLVFITIDDAKIRAGGRSLHADGVNVHAFLMPRAQFRRMVEGAIRNTFMHSFLARGRLLYTHDDTIGELCSRLNEIGERDTQVQLMRAGLGALGPLDKARKWLITRGDLDYTALWILYAATPLAQIEVFGRRLLADREVIPQAMTFNPEFFTKIYTQLLNSPKARANVETALAAAEQYLAERAPVPFAPILEHLRDVGEARSCTELEDHFERNMDVSGITLACEYLADRDIIGKVSIAVQLTKKSNVTVEELAFVDVGWGTGMD